jgi:hypothetical protein
MDLTDQKYSNPYLSTNVDTPSARLIPTFSAETKEKMETEITASTTPPSFTTEAQKLSREQDSLRSLPGRGELLSGSGSLMPPVSFRHPLEDVNFVTPPETIERDRTGESFPYRHDIYSKPELTAADLEELQKGAFVHQELSTGALAHTGQPLANTPAPARVRPTFERSARVPIHVSHYPGAKKAEMSIVVTTDFHDGGNTDSICIPLELGITEALYIKRGLDEFISEYVRRYASHE